MQGTTGSFKSTWSEDVKSSHIQHDIAPFRHIAVTLDGNKKIPIDQMGRSQLVSHQTSFA